MVAIQNERCKSGCSVVHENLEGSHKHERLDTHPAAVSIIFHGELSCIFGRSTRRW